MSVKNIAIFGYNPMSFELIKCLDLKQHEVIIVDQHQDSLIAATDLGFTVIATDYRNDDNLQEVGIGRHIDVLFCFFEEDSSNLFLTISARAMDKKLEIISIVDDPESADKLIVAGANKIIDPYQICGRKIYQLIKNPDIADVLDHTIFGRHDLNTAEILIPPDSPLEKTYASQLQLNSRYNLILIAIVDKELGKELHFTIGEQDHKLDAGDILIVLGPSRQIKAFKKEVEKQA